MCASLRVFHDARQKAHAPETFVVAGRVCPIPEVPERADRLLTAVERLGLQPETPHDHGLAPIAAVHTPEYVDFLQTIHADWRAAGGSEQVVPSIHPLARTGTYPGTPAGRAGYHQADTSCPIVGETWEAARISAHAAASTAHAVLGGERQAYALCRPPGHHAFADLAGGFCFLNNSAIAAEVLREQHGRVAILDVDLHHGNGTQGIFYHRADVLTASVHVDPAVFYPFFWGFAEERGAGAGLGYNRNLPLPVGAGDDAFLQALDDLLVYIAAFAPGAVVVALGLDASGDDPFGGLAVTPDGFARIGARIGALDLPVALIQEGGYISASLDENLYRFLDGFLEAR